MSKFLVVKAESAQLADILAGTAPIYQTIHGFGAEATATVSEGAITVEIVAGGNGYLTEPVVRIETSGKGFGATAIATVEDGAVTAIEVDMSQAKDYEDDDPLKVIIEDTYVTTAKYLASGTPSTESLRFCGGDVFAVVVPDAELADEPKSEDTSSGGEDTTSSDSGEDTPSESSSSDDNEETPPAEEANP